MKNEILIVAARHIQMYGVRKFKLDLICKELKISKKTIYKYFQSKDEIVEEYIKEILETDKESTIKILNENISLSKKCHNIIYSYHKYKLPINVMEDIKRNYKCEWEKLKQLKEFKINAIFNLLEVAKKNGEIKEEVDLSVITIMIEKISEELLDSDMLRVNNLKLNYAIDQLLQVILNGILK